MNIYEKLIVLKLFEAATWLEVVLRANLLANFTKYSEFDSIKEIMCGSYDIGSAERPYI